MLHIVPVLSGVNDRGTLKSLVRSRAAVPRISSGIEAGATYMRRPPPPHRLGEPRTAGSGRRRGSLNKRTVELRELMNSLVADVHYQERLRLAFARRRLHPSTELRIWEYSIGKPKIEMSAQLSIDARLAAEREALQQLDLSELEKLAAESQALIDRAVAAAQEQARVGVRGIVAAPCLQVVPPVRRIGTVASESAKDHPRPVSGESPEE